jgi:hypothetical protein
MRDRISRQTGVVMAILLSSCMTGEGAEPRRVAPVVAELFTSQGCSSCPPAEALLGELTRRADILPLAFHVTYWDGLGWRDRFSFREADTRQYRYASAMNKRGVYTPQMVVNGSREVLGSSRTDVLKVIGSTPPPLMIRLSVTDGVIRAELPELEGGCDCDLLLLGVQPSAKTAVGRGENAGRLLQEFNIVRQIHSLAGWNGRASARTQPIPALPADASLLVLLAQRRDNAQIAAVGVAPWSGGVVQAG